MTETSGTVIAVDVPNSSMSINTRLGPKAFVVNSNTLVFLNGRASNLQAVQPGDRVDLEYRFDTGVIFNLEIVREASRRGRVVSATETALVYQVNGTGRLNFTTDALTVAGVAGLRVDDLRALAGLRGNAVYQPGQGNPLLLRFGGDGALFTGRITSVDLVNSRVVVAGRTTRAFRLVDFGGVRINGTPTDLSGLVVGDRVRVASVGRPGALRAVVIQALR